MRMWSMLAVRLLVGAVGSLCLAMPLVFLARADDVPTVEGHCVENCPDSPPVERERPDPPEHPYTGPSAAELEQQAFEKSAIDYRGVVERINAFISNMSASSSFDPTVKTSVLTIFGNTRSLPLPHAADYSSLPNTSAYQALEAEVRAVRSTYPGLGSASLYDADLPRLAIRTADMSERVRALQTLRDELRQWYRDHSGPETEAEYRDHIAERVRKIEELERESKKLYDQARTSAQGATASAKGVLAQLELPVPTALSTDNGQGPVYTAADAYADGLVPLTADAKQDLLGMDVAFWHTTKDMPDWSHNRPFAERLAPWYAHYTDHFYSNGTPIAFAEVIPQPPGPIKRFAVPATPEQARNQADSEIKRLSQDLQRLSAAINAYAPKHAAYQAASADYESTATAIQETAKPAFWSLHEAALSLVADDRNRRIAKSLYFNVYEAARSVAWENIAHQLSEVPSVTHARREALKSAIALVPSIKQFANDEFAEILKGPKVLAFGDDADAAEIESKLHEHVCELISDRTPFVQHLPAFLTPYISHASCSAP